MKHFTGLSHSLCDSDLPTRKQSLSLHFVKPKHAISASWRFITGDRNFFINLLYQLPKGSGQIS